MARFNGLKAFVLALVGLGGGISIGLGKTSDPIGALIAEKMTAANVAPIAAPHVKRGVVLVYAPSNLTEASLKAEIDCLAKNVFHEARGESVEGQKAVVAVTLNRLNLARWGRSVCDVVYAPYHFRGRLSRRLRPTNAWSARRTSIAPSAPA